MRCVFLSLSVRLCLALGMCACNRFDTCLKLNRCKHKITDVKREKKALNSRVLCNNTRQCLEIAFQVDVRLHFAWCVCVCVLECWKPNSYCLLFACIDASRLGCQHISTNTSIFWLCSTSTNAGGCSTDFFFRFVFFSALMRLRNEKYTTYWKKKKKCRERKITNINGTKNQLRFTIERNHVNVCDDENVDGCRPNSQFILSINTCKRVCDIASLRKHENYLFTWNGREREKKVTDFYKKKNVFFCSRFLFSAKRKKTIKYAWLKVKPPISCVIHERFLFGFVRALNAFVAISRVSKWQ